MTTNFLQTKLSSILEVAERIQSYFSNSAYENIRPIIKSVIKKHDAIFAYDKIASDNYKFMIISQDPHKVLLEIIRTIKNENSPTYQTVFNPTSIITKLANKEFMLDIGGVRLCYCIKSSVPSNYLLKSFACRVIASVKSYYNFMDPESCSILSDKIQELHPLYDYRTDTKRIEGGKKRTTTTLQKKKKNIRVDILSRLIEYIRNNPAISIGIILINDLDDCTFSAINIAYTENKFKDAIVDYLRLLIETSYSTYSFKTFMHADFSIPYDFRMKKHSCLINDKTSQQPTYLANLYNNPTYEPMPCIKSYVRESFLQLAHPVVKLRFLYIDMFMVEHKMKSDKRNDSIHQNRMLKHYNDIITFDKTPTWIGFYKDEGYEKNKFNMKSNVSNPIDTFYI